MGDNMAILLQFLEVFGLLYESSFFFEKFCFCSKLVVCQPFKALSKIKQKK